MAQIVEVPLVCSHNTQFSVVVETEGSKNVSFSLLRHPNDQFSATLDPELVSRKKGDILVVDSIKSGTGRDVKNDFCTNVIQPVFTELGLDYRVVKTENENSVAELGRNFRPCGQNTTVIFLSGDTSISEFVNNLTQEQQGTIRPTVNLLALPLGTGNAWANSLGFRTAATALAEFLQGFLKPKNFPLYKAIFPNGYEIVFFIILSIGFHANLLHLCDQPRFKKLGVERFRLASKEIFEDYILDYPLQVTQRPLEHYSYFALINTPNLEQNYKPSPKSNPLTSELHLLGYSSGLPQPMLINRIMKGYSNQPETDINEEGVTYQASFQ